MYHNILLAFDFAKRDFKERYVGTGLGQFWYILSPIITIFIYTVIFSDFMKMKLHLEGSTNSEYAYSIYLIPGLFSWNFFSLIVDRISNSFFEKANFIKKVNIPVYVFQISIFLSDPLYTILE